MQNIPGFIIEAYAFGAMLYMCRSTYKLHCRYDAIANQTMKIMSIDTSDSAVSAVLGDAIEARYNATKDSLRSCIYNLSVAILLPMIAMLIYTITFGAHLIKEAGSYAMSAFIPNSTFLFTLSLAIGLGCAIHQAQHLFRAKLLLPSTAPVGPGSVS